VDRTRLRLVVTPNHRPSTLSAEPPVTSAQPLWRLLKSGHVAEALVFLVVWCAPGDRRVRKRPITAEVLWPFLTTSRSDRAAAA
jgi:hypothetical protein